jgi:hypothetical protein
VRRSSNGAQVPWESTSLEDDFWFIPPKELKRLSDAEVEREFKEESAVWTKADAASDPAPIEAYLKRYPSGRFSELAQVRLDALLAAQGEKKIELVTSPANPYSKGSARADTQYKVGDVYIYTNADAISKVVHNTVTGTVTRVTEQEVFYDDGRVVTDRLGNFSISPRDRFYGNQTHPAEFQLGRQWRTRFTGERPASGAFTIEATMRVTARESITVGAGTFDAFRVESEGARYTSVGTFRFNGRTWYAPERVRRFILREEVVKTMAGRVSNAERSELVYFRQS